MNTYIALFFTFFKIGLFAFGGGYAVISLIQHDIIDVHPEWGITTQEFTDIIAISQCTPGPIGINAATYVGYAATHSWIGSLIATFSMVLPTFIIMLVLCVGFSKLQGNKYMSYAFSSLRPATIGLIAAAALLLCNHENFIDYKSFIIFAVAIVACFIKKIHPILIILASGLAGWIIY